MADAAEITACVHRLCELTAHGWGQRPQWLEDAIPGLELWLQELNTWNQRMDLSAAKSPEELADLMLADSLALAHVAHKDTRWVDVGCGAGAPGLGLAICRPDLSMTLVEPLSKRVSFLRTVIGKLGRRDIPVKRQKGQADIGRARYDVALSRATLAPETWLELGCKLAPQGSVWVLLALAETPSSPAGWTLGRELHYEWHLTGRKRRLALYTADLNSAFPPEESSDLQVFSASCAAGCGAAHLK